MEIIQNLHSFRTSENDGLYISGGGTPESVKSAIKGDAYDIQNGNCWMKVYQVKMKNYKRVPDPDNIISIGCRCI